MMILAINWTNALIVTVVGFLLVFVVLVLLIVIITLFGKVMAPTVKVPKQTKGEAAACPACPSEETEDRHISADESAAIAMALYLAYEEVHDEESHVITIKKVERRYSPWSSKIYGINNLVR